jgi:hypothetical protein
MKTVLTIMLIIAYIGVFSQELYREPREPVRRVQARVVSEIETRAFTHLAGSENDKFLRKMGKSGA